MNHPNFLRAGQCEPDSPSLHCSGGDPVKPLTSAERLVGNTVQSLSDEVREQQIHNAGRALVDAKGRADAARRRYAESSCLTDKADQDAAELQAREALRLMEVLIWGRSAAQVARMEREQAQRMTREPGAAKG
jgi:hypothetical protein